MSRVAVVGAGIAGLACARELAACGHEVRVFEKSHGLGGRAATRRADCGAFDHGAQYFTAREPEFRDILNDWLAAGVAAAYGGRIVALRDGRMFTDTGSEARYVGVPGMNALGRSLAGDLDVVRECTVSAVTPGESGWRVSWEDGGDYGFDAAVVAVPADQASTLLLTSAELSSTAQNALHAPCWAVMVSFDAAVGADFDAAFVASSALGWAMRDSSKPGRAAGERWVLHASTEWSQEHLEDDVAAVAASLPAVFTELIGSTLRPSWVVAHRWRYALSRGLGAGFLWDAHLHLGAAGDWCADGRIEGAFLSGLKLAREVSAGLQDK